MTHPIIITSYMNVFNNVPRIPSFDPLQNNFGLSLRYDSDIAIRNDWKSRRFIVYEHQYNSELRIFISIRGTVISDFRQLIYDISTTLVEFKNIKYK